MNAMQPILMLNLARTGNMFDFGPGPRRTGSNPGLAAPYGSGYGSAVAGKANMLGGAGTDPDDHDPEGAELFLLIVVSIIGVILFAIIAAKLVSNLM